MPGINIDSRATDGRAVIKVTGTDAGDKSCTKVRIVMSGFVTTLGVLLFLIGWS